MLVLSFGPTRPWALPFTLLKTFVNKPRIVCWRTRGSVKQRSAVLTSHPRPAKETAYA